jgi:hypothetical protein
MVQPRRYRTRDITLLGLVPAATFAAVTWGLEPTVNLIARLNSPGNYSQWGFSGTWRLGLIVAAVTFTITAFLIRRQARR